MEYYSQYGQDEYLDKVIFKGMENGVFVDIGAHDGIFYSNSYFFEKYRHWTGICIEPLPERFEELVRNRKSVNLNLCVDHTEGKKQFVIVGDREDMLSYVDDSSSELHKQRIKENVEEQKIQHIEVVGKRLSSILEEQKVREVDFCSIDVEGSERNVLRSIDFGKVRIKVFSIENNYGDSWPEWYLLFRGYKLVKLLGPDNVFVLQDNKYPFIVKQALKKTVKKVLRTIGLSKGT